MSIHPINVLEILSSFLSTIAKRAYYSETLLSGVCDTALICPLGPLVADEQLQA